jgi:hypothetical protein
MLAIFAGYGVWWLWRLVAIDAGATNAHALINLSKSI